MPGLILGAYDQRKLFQLRSIDVRHIAIVTTNDPGGLGPWALDGHSSTDTLQRGVSRRGWRLQTRLIRSPRFTASVHQRAAGVEGAAVRTTIRAVLAIRAERGRLPTVLCVLLQAIALLAVMTVIRDDRPKPTTDPVAWERMGAFALFASTASLAVLFTVTAFVSLYAYGAPNAAARSHDCRLLAGTLAIGAVLVDTELLCLGLWKGTWEMFRPMAAIAPLDFVLTFLVLRCSD